MQFSSFIVCTCLSAAAYYLLPARGRKVVIATTDFVFYYLMAGMEAAILLLIVCIAAWCAAFFLDPSRQVRRHSSCERETGQACRNEVCSTVSGSREKARGQISRCRSAILMVFVSFAVLLLAAVRLKISIRDHMIAALGISFYMLEAISYVADVYLNRAEAGSFLDAVCYLSFFPTVVSGPIERAGDFFTQLQHITTSKRRTLIDAQRVWKSVVLIVYAIFLKFVIADRLGILTDYVFQEHVHLGSTGLLLGVVGYGFQLYCDFAGYSLLMIALANIFGIQLVNNFTAPYLCSDIRSFWKHWHISLSSWLQDYIYIPLGGNRKGKLRKYCNVMVTFLVSGLWHGTGLTFLIWGGLHGLYQIIADMCRNVRKKTHDSGTDLLLVLLTFFLVDFAWIFFRASDVRSAADIISGIFTRPDFYQMGNGGIFEYGLDAGEWMILIPAMLVMLAVDLVQSKREMRLDHWIVNQGIIFQVVFVLFLTLYSLIYGIYGPNITSGEFIYAQF